MNIEEYLKKYPMGSSYLKYSANVYSQNGEDGILKKLLDELNIKEGTLVEFGAWDGIYLSNIYNLHKDGNFKAILIEGDEKRISSCRIKSEKVSIHNFFISPNREDPNSIDNVLKSIGYENKKDDLVIMSIDVDSSDYYIMESIEEHRPIIIVIETNIGFPIGSKFKSFDRGCSFDSVWELGKKMGYSVVAYTSNVILVRSDYLSRLNEYDENFSIEEMYINSEQYLTLGKIDEEGNITDSFFVETDHYKNKINLE